MTLQEKIVSYLESNGRIAWASDVCAHIYGEGFTRSHRETLRQTAERMEKKGLLFSGAFFAFTDFWTIPGFIEDEEEMRRINGNLLFWLPGVNVLLSSNDELRPLEVYREFGSQHGGRVSGKYIRSQVAQAILDYHNGGGVCRVAAAKGKNGVLEISIYFLRQTAAEKMGVWSRGISSAGDNSKGQCTQTRFHVAIMRALHRFKDEGLVSFWYDRGNTRMPSWVEVKDIDGIRRYASDS